MPHSRLFAALGWLAAGTVIFRFGLRIVEEGGNVAASLTYFTYFTIWTNILVASLCLGAARAASCSAGRAAALTAGTMFILFVGVVYHVLLAETHHPEGLSVITNLLLHYVVPAAMLVLWIIAVPKGQVAVWQPFLWLSFPLVYLVFALVRGSYVGKYPYFFIDVGKYGMEQVLVNAAGFTTFLLVLGFVFVIADRVLGRVRRVA